MTNTDKRQSSRKPRVRYDRDDNGNHRLPPDLARSEFERCTGMAWDDSRVVGLTLKYLLGAWERLEVRTGKAGQQPLPPNYVGAVKAAVAELGTGCTTLLLGFVHGLPLAKAGNDVGMPCDKARYTRLRRQLYTVAHR